MGNMRNWILGAAVVAGLAGLGTTTAQAAEFGFRVRGPVAYVPPCPGPGYVWTAGYMANGYWVPGFWNRPVFRGGGYEVRHDRGFDRGREMHFDRDRHFDRGNERFRR